MPRGISDERAKALADEHFGRWREAVRARDPHAVGALWRVVDAIRAAAVREERREERRRERQRQWEEGTGEMGTVDTILDRAVLERYGYGPLTPMQVRLLQRMADGDTRNDTAAAVGMTPEAVKEQLKAIYRKLNARNGTHAVVIAMQNGWVK